MKRAGWFALLAVAASYYACLISNGAFRFWSSATEAGWNNGAGVLGRTFNSMLLHLLHGRFDVDPGAIRWEAIVKDGKTYAYFGVAPALARLVALPLVDLRTLDVSLLFCLLAATLAAAFKLRALRTAQAAGAGGPAFVAMVVVTLFAGAQVQFLRPSVYQEALLWAGAFAAGFVAVALGGLLGARGFTDRALLALAALAALALLARVTTGAGLSLALLALLALLVARERRQGGLRAARFVAPLLVLGVGVLAVGVVNYGRFGNPLTFAQPLLQFYTHPDGIPALTRYGVFNVRRLPYGLMYYFAPVWWVHDAPAHLAFAEFQERLLDLVELPPSSFLLSDPLLLVVAALGLGVLLRPTTALDRRAAALLATALAVPPLALLTAFVLAFRYRMDFYPVLELLALLALAGSPALRPGALSPRVKRTVIVLGCASVLASHALLVLYKASP
ncbi:MAG TPA: hypothetical protein VFL90_02230, partial [Methylomirabilota bacterium]|nr:hypothetical protein [Methylomirabilota bacterium]